MSLLEVLINPQGRERGLSEPGLVCTAASAAGIGQSQLKRRLCANRFDRLPPRGLVDRPFASLAWRRWVRLDADHPAPWCYDDGDRRGARPAGCAR